MKKGPTPEEIADPDFNGYWQDESGDWVKYCNPEDLWPDDPELMKYWETFIKREMPLEFVFRAAKTHRSMKSIYYDIPYQRSGNGLMHWFKRIEMNAERISY